MIVAYELLFLIKGGQRRGGRALFFLDWVVVKLNMHLVISLLVPWAFWGILAALLYYASRSWFNVMLIPVLITIVILIVAAVAPSREAMWFSLLLHLVMFVYFLVSCRSFVTRDRGVKEKE